MLKSVIVLLGLAVIASAGEWSDELKEDLPIMEKDTRDFEKEVKEFVVMYNDREKNDFNTYHNLRIKLNNISYSKVNNKIIEWKGIIYKKGYDRNLMSALDTISSRNLSIRQAAGHLLNDFWNRFLQRKTRKDSNDPHFNTLKDTTPFDFSHIRALVNDL